MADSREGQKRPITAQGPKVSMKNASPQKTTAPRQKVRQGQDGVTTQTQNKDLLPVRSYSMLSRCTRPEHRVIPTVC